MTVKTLCRAPSLRILSRQAIVDKRLAGRPRCPRPSETPHRRPALLHWTSFLLMILPPAGLGRTGMARPAAQDRPASWILMVGSLSSMVQFRTEGWSLPHRKGAVPKAFVFMLITWLEDGCLSDFWRCLNPFPRLEIKLISSVKKMLNVS